MADVPGDSRADPEVAALPYRLRTNFLSVAEIGVYRALKALTGEHYVIFAKVALNEIFSIARPNENVHYFNKLFRKYVDYLLCHPDSLRPQVGVELIRVLPGGSMREADQFVGDLFLAAGLPLVQVRSGDSFEPAALATLFEQAFAKVKHVDRKATDSSQDSVPLCPVCGKMMVLRTKRGGKTEGRLYYGCIDNPTCPGSVALK